MPRRRYYGARSRKRSRTLAGLLGKFLPAPPGWGRTYGYMRKRVQGKYIHPSRGAYHRYRREMRRRSRTRHPYS